MSVKDRVKKICGWVLSPTFMIANSARKWLMNHTLLGRVIQRGITNATNNPRFMSKLKLQVARIKKMLLTLVKNIFDDKGVAKGIMYNRKGGILERDVKKNAEEIDKKADSIKEKANEAIKNKGKAVDVALSRDTGKAAVGVKRTGNIDKLIGDASPASAGLAINAAKSLTKDREASR